MKGQSRLSTPSIIQLLTVNIYFLYKIFSLDKNQYSIKNANIADKKDPETHKTKQIKCWIIHQETIRKLVDEVERLE